MIHRFSPGTQLEHISRRTDAVWDEAARHYDEQALAALVVQIAVTNVFNRLNVSTRQVPGQWG